jgi:C1A family cysteine protease
MNKKNIQFQKKVKLSILVLTLFGFILLLTGCSEDVVQEIVINAKYDGNIYNLANQISSLGGGFSNYKIIIPDNSSSELEQSVKEFASEINFKGSILRENELNKLSHDEKRYLFYLTNNPSKVGLNNNLIYLYQNNTNIILFIVSEEEDGLLTGLDVLLNYDNYKEELNSNLVEFVPLMNRRPNFANKQNISPISSNVKENILSKVTESISKSFNSASSNKRSNSRISSNVKLPDNVPIIPPDDDIDNTDDSPSEEVSLISEEINENFTSNWNYMLDFEDAVSVFGITGNISLHSLDSLVRIIMVDKYSNEFLVHESFPLLVDSWDYNFEYLCEETCILANNHPSHLKIQIIDATLNLDSIDYKEALFNLASDSFQSLNEAKQDVHEQQITNKVERINENLEKKGFYWGAGETDLSKLSYQEKKDIMGVGEDGELFNTYGFEYYVEGIFHISEINSEDFENDELGLFGSSDSNYTSFWDWRTRHGANDPDSAYYTGRNTGWVSSVKNQGGCGACWSFSAISVIELVSSLYFNQDLDLDLSEQEVMDCTNQGCAGGWVRTGLIYSRDNGIVPEECFPYQASDGLCSNRCDDPTNLIKINNYIQHYPGSSVSPLSIDDIKKLIIEKGSTSIELYGNWNHAMHVTGFGKIQEGDRVRNLTHTSERVINSDDPLINQTYWLIKNSWGSSWGDQGFGKFWLPPKDIYKLVTITLPITSTNISYDVLCRDEDLDGYCTWGLLSNKPATGCPITCSLNDEPDSDDSNHLLGGFAEDYSSISISRCRDYDGDGYPNTLDPEYSSDCQYQELDCDPYNSEINPGAIEVCNGMDSNCDGIIDTGCYPENPFEIKTCDDLQRMNVYLNSYHILVNDIDCSDTINWNDGEGFIPIGNNINKFNGTLNGEGYVISGLYINRSSENYVGLFGYSKGDINNVGLVNFNITGNYNVGGLIGYQESGNVKYSFSNGDISGIDVLGGFVGYSSGLISNSYSEGNVIRYSGNGEIIGGFVGYNYLGIISNSYSTVSVLYLNDSNPNDKGFIGSIETGLGYEMYGNLWDIEKSGQNYSLGNASGKTTIQMKDIQIYLDYGWDIQLDGVDMNNGYPYLTNLDDNSSTWKIYGQLSVSATNASNTWFNYPKNAEIFTLSPNEIIEIRYYFEGFDSFNIGCTSGGNLINNGDILTEIPVNGSVLYLCARDSEDNVAIWQGVYNWENTVPECGYWEPEESPWKSGGSQTFVLNGSTDEGGSGINVSWGSCQTGVNHGDRCNISISDNAGNSVICVSPENKIDNSVPELSIPEIYLGLKYDIYFRETISIISYINDTGLSGLNESSCEVKLNDGDWDSSNVIFNSNSCLFENYSSNDNFTISFRIKNNVGTYSESIVKSFIYDDVAPITLINDTNSEFRLENLTFDLDCYDAGSGCNETYYKILEGNFNCNSSEMDIYSSSVDLECEYGICEFTVCYYSIDNLNNIENVNKQLYQIDVNLNLGTIDNPFQISNDSEFQDINKNTSAYYIILNDINLSDTINWNCDLEGENCKGWEPISLFNGTLDGQGNIISGLYINRSSENYVGLFGNTIGGNILNIGLVDVNIKGNDMVGGLVGSVDGTIINDSYVIGNILGNNLVGGLVGRNYYGNIFNSYSEGSIIGTSNVGGFVGFYQGDGIIGNISDSYSRANVTLKNNAPFYIGGFIGHNHFGTIINSYSTGFVNATTFWARGFIGRNSNNEPPNAGVINSFWDVESSGKIQRLEDKGNGLTTAQMKDIDTFLNAGWNFTHLWDIDIETNDGYPFLIE